MKHIIRMLVAFSLVFPSIGFSGPQQQHEQAILGWLMTVDNNEISAATLTLQQPVSHSVKKYAKMLKKDHSKNLNQTLALSRKLGLKPVMEDSALALKQQGQEMTQELKTTDKKDYEKQYLGDMIKGHEAVLTQLQKDISQTNDTRLKMHLEKTRVSVARHLAAAQQLQSDLSA